MYKPGTKCSVSGCEKLAEYEVYLYDYYPNQNQEFFEQDFTCPFLCVSHVEENEQNMRGERKPRGTAFYPYTNRYNGQGYTKYAPISDVFPLLYAATTLAEGRRIVASVDEINSELISYLAHHPELMHELNPRKFEELVATLLRSQGFNPTITPQTRDGGRDIIATRSDPLGDLLYVVECKRYAPNKKVGVQQVRGIYGVAQSERATKAILVTTSSFTPDAVAFATPLKYNVMLADFHSLKTWIEAAATNYID